MKPQIVKVNVDSIDTISTNIDRSLEINLVVKKDDFIDSVLDEFQLKDIFHIGSYSVEEVVDTFGMEEISKYIYDLGSR